MVASIQIKGYKELQRDIRRQSDRDLPRRMGQAHKDVGQLVVDRLSPDPVPSSVGEGSGHSVRPSATKREVLLRVGGAHRDDEAEQWGKTQVFKGLGQTDPRPYIKGTIEDNQKQIEEEFLDAIKKAMKPAFWKVR